MVIDYVASISWCFSQGKLVQVAEQKQGNIDFFTCNVTFTLFKTNGLLAEQPNYLDTALTKAECSEIKSRNVLRLSR